MKFFNLGANAIVSKRVLDLARDIPIDIAEPVQEQDQQHQGKGPHANNQPCEDCMTTRKISPTPGHRWLVRWWSFGMITSAIRMIYTHIAQPHSGLREVRILEGETES